MDNILESYLVKLGAAVDTASFKSFNDVLKASDKSALSATSSIAANFIKLDATITGVIGSIGVGMISMMDRTANLDQQYRLFGMRMLMTKESARAMAVATDELGASLDEIAYDPELNRRFQYLYEQNIKLGRAMGKDFDSNMRLIRDFRMEYKMLTAEVQFFLGAVASKLFEKIGGGSGDALEKFQKLNNYITGHLPEWSDQVSTELTPVWKDFTAVAKDAGETLKIFAGDFQFLSGIIFQDESIQTTDVNIQTLIKTTKDWISLMATGALMINGMFKTGGRLTEGIEKGVQAKIAEWKGDNKTAIRLYAEAEKSGDQGWLDLKNLLFGNTSDFLKNPDLHSLGKLVYDNDHPSVATNPSLAETILKASKKYQVDPNLISAIIDQESQYHTGAVSSKGAQGLMQLMPSVQKDYNVFNPFDANQNVNAGTAYFKKLFDKYGNVAEALAAYNAGSGNVDKYGGIPPFNETQDYVRSVLQRYNTLRGTSAEHGSPVTIQHVEINVPHNLPDDQWSHFVHESFKEQSGLEAQKTMAQTAAGAYW